MSASTDGVFEKPFVSRVGRQIAVAFSCSRDLI